MKGLGSLERMLGNEEVTGNNLVRSNATLGSISGNENGEKSMDSRDIEGVKTTGLSDPADAKCHHDPD